MFGFAWCCKIEFHRGNGFPGNLGHCIYLQSNFFGDITILVYKVQCIIEY